MTMWLKGLNPNGKGNSNKNRAIKHTLNLPFETLKNDDVG